MLTYYFDRASGGAVCTAIRDICANKGTTAAWLYLIRVVEDNGIWKLELPDAIKPLVIKTLSDFTPFPQRFSIFRGLADLLAQPPNTKGRPFKMHNVLHKLDKVPRVDREGI